jgi:hypothetical protein
VPNAPSKTTDARPRAHRTFMDPSVFLIPVTGIVSPRLHPSKSRWACSSRPRRALSQSGVTIVCAPDDVERRRAACVVLRTSTRCRTTASWFLAAVVRPQPILAVRMRREAVGHSSAMLR